MTNDNIKEAARLVDEIDQLEEVRLKKGSTFALCRELTAEERSWTVYGSRFLPVAGVGLSAAAEIVGTLIARKKARLNDLRAGC